MAFAVSDRVRETTTTTGTGTLNLGGAVSGFRTFVSGIGDGNVTYYAIVHRTSAEFEIGIGTVTAGLKLWRLAGTIGKGVGVAEAVDAGYAP